MLLQVRWKYLMSAEVAAEDEEIVQALEHVVGWVTDHWLYHGSTLLHRSTLVEAHRPPI